MDVMVLLVHRASVDHADRKVCKVSAGWMAHLGHKVNAGWTVWLGHKDRKVNVDRKVIKARRGHKVCVASKARRGVMGEMVRMPRRQV